MLEILVVSFGNPFKIADVLEVIEQGDEDNADNDDT